jgi:PPOX class probable F420-dependent enzyme
MREWVRTARVARLATTGPDGRPHLVPIVFVLDGQTLYSAVDAKPKRSRRLRRVANARERPDVTVLVDHYVAVLLLCAAGSGLRSLSA